MITEEILSGRLEAPGFIEGGFFVRQAWLKVSWAGDSIGQINPVVETDAAAKRVANQFSTSTSETAALTGGDYGENVQTLAREKAMRARVNISDPDSVASAEKLNAEADAPGGKLPAQVPGEEVNNETE
jgi:capsid protein